MPLSTSLSGRHSASASVRARSSLLTSPRNRDENTSPPLKGPISSLSRQMKMFIEFLPFSRLSLHVAKSAGIYTVNRRKMQAETPGPASSSWVHDLCSRLPGFGDHLGIGKGASTPFPGHPDLPNVNNEQRRPQAEVAQKREPQIAF